MQNKFIKFIYRFVTNILTFQFTLCGFYEGVIELTSTCASKIDHEEYGIHFYLNGEPDDDREGYATYAAR